MNPAKRCIDVEDMIDRKAKAYKDLYMDYIDEKKREGTLFENPALFRTPIVRNGKEFTLGYCPDVWEKLGIIKEVFVYENRIGTAGYGF